MLSTSDLPSFALDNGAVEGAAEVHARHVGGDGAQQTGGRLHVERVHVFVVQRWEAV